MSSKINAIIGTVFFFLSVFLCGDAMTAQIADLKIRMFFQYTGELSMPLTGKEDLWNVMAGGGEFPEPTSSAFVDVTVSDTAKTYVERKAINLVVKNKRTGKIIERLRGYTGIFGPSGSTHVGFWLRSVNCEPLLLIASTEGSSKSQALLFKCGE